MKSMWEKSMCCSGARVLFAFAGAGGSRASGLVARTRSSRSPARQQAGAEVVRIELSEPLAAVPAGFTVQAPPRIAIDLPGVDQRARQVDRRDQPGQPALGQRGPGRRAHAPGPEPQAAGQLPRRSSTARCWSSSLENIAPATLAELAAPASRRASPKASTATSCRCRTSTSAAAPTAPAASSSSCRTTRSASTSASRARTWWSSSCARRLPDSLRRRLDVTDFGTPVQSVTTTQSGDRVRMVVEPRGAWEHSAYQSDNQFVLEVRAAEGRPEQAVAGRRLRGREAVAQLPEHRGPRAAAGDRRLHQLQRRHQRHRHRQRHAAPEGRALGPGARHHPAGQGPGPAQVGQRDPGSRPRTSSNAKEKLELEAKQQIAELEPLRTQSFQLNYTKAEDIAKGLTGQSTAAAAAAPAHAHPVAARQRRSSSRAPTSCSSPTSRPSSKRSRR